MAAAEFMGQALEDRVRYVLRTLEAERKRHQGISPPWLDSCIYQIEIGISDLEGARIAAQTLQATIMEVLDILGDENTIGGAMRKIGERWKALLRTKAGEVFYIDGRAYRYNPNTGTHEGVEDGGQG